MNAPLPVANQLYDVDITWPKGPLLSEIAGAEAATRFGETLAADLAAIKTGAVSWSDIDPGCLLYGPPGTGKTTLARAIAARCGTAFIATSYSEWAQGADSGNDVISRIAAAFQAARSNTPCIVFIDEIDSFPRRGQSSHNASYFASLNNALLTEIGGHRGVIVIGACNDPTALDPALIRSGRLDQLIEVPLPAPNALPRIFKYHLGMAATQIRELDRLAFLCVGKSGADIAKIVRSAKRIARADNALLTDEHLEKAITTELVLLPLAQRRTIAVHEAGHAAILYRSRPAAELVVSLPSAITFSGGQINLSFCSRDDVQEHLVHWLAGRAAEEILLGRITGGSGGSEHSDLGRATKLALEAIAQRGLSSSGQLGWYGPSAGSGVSDSRCSEEAEAWLSAAYATALKRVAEDDLFVAMIAHVLLERGVLTLAEITSIERIMTSFRATHTKAELLFSLGFEPVVKVDTVKNRRRAGNA